MRKLAYTGFGISIVGAALDFASGYYSMGSMAVPSGTMGGPSTASVTMYVLGIVVLFGGVLLVLPGMAGSMRRLGLLMEVLGVVMALASYLVPGMNLGLSYAMLLVGAAMILNGAYMQRREPAMEHG
jgi:hypothetical protein